MRGVAATGERRIRGGIVMAELADSELEAFLSECQRQRRTTGFLGGRIIAEWLKARGSQERRTDQREEAQASQERTGTRAASSK